MEITIRIDRAAVRDFKDQIENGDNYIDVVSVKQTDQGNFEIKLIVEKYDDLVSLGKFYFG